MAEAITKCQSYDNSSDKVSTPQLMEKDLSTSILSLAAPKIFAS
jgi:hypothetical protein